jgi:hypothetical protein
MLTLWYQITIIKAVLSQNDFSQRKPDLLLENWPIITKRMKFAILATRINVCGKIG